MIDYAFFVDVDTVFYFGLKNVEEGIFEVQIDVETTDAEDKLVLYKGVFDPVNVINSGVRVKFIGRGIEQRPHE